MSVKAIHGGMGDPLAEFHGAAISVNMGPQTLMFLDQVDAEVMATARVQRPEGEENVLSLARQSARPRPCCAPG
ncbi:MAG: hypothetical protein AAFV19_22450 [Pseudomonadota bacterium]